MATVNRQITLASRPVGFPKVANFHLVYSPLPSLAAGEVLVRSVYLSLDPYLRGLMNEAEPDARPVAIGDVMIGAVVAFVVLSQDPGFRSGETVEGMLGWQEYAVAKGRDLRKIDPVVAPISTALGVLGLPGLTAYFGLLDVCKPQRGETVVISGATGAVGMIAGQLAKHRGCRVVGVAGSDAKVSWLQSELGFDAAVNDSCADDLQVKLGELCPDGIDIYFDNVGGVVTDAVMRRLNVGARVSVCGQISQLNLEAPEVGPRWLARVVVKQAKVQGFPFSDYVNRFPEGRERLARWLRQGKLKYREDVAQGIEAAPQAFIEMLHGRNQGKQLVQLSEEAPPEAMC